MSVAKEFTKDLQDKVYYLLKNFPPLRNSDRALSCRLWTTILGEDNCKKYTAWDFMCEYAKSDSKLPSQESIGRERRRQQEIHAELRGTKYIARHLEQDAVKEKLGYEVRDNFAPELKENYGE